MAGYFHSVAVDDRLGSFTYENDTQTTNLYLGNINPKVNLIFEIKLMTVLNLLNFFVSMMSLVIDCIFELVQYVSVTMNSPDSWIPVEICKQS